MLTRVLERTRAWRFGRAIRRVLKAPPVEEGDQDFAALSMVRGVDTLAYLLAIKSFAQQARPSRIIVVADPTLGVAHRRLIRSHVPRAEIVDCAMFRRAAVPVGGCWERLSAIAALSCESYVVQLDADTLTSGEPTEVLQAIDANVTFLLRSEGHVEVVSLEDAQMAGRRARELSSHIQVAAEARLAELPESLGLRYARGCAGFAGFGRGAIWPERLDDISRRMRELHGARWDEWGTEQVACNLLAASACRSSLLPHPRYCNADSETSASLFTHYIGYARFTTRGYERKATKIAKELSGVDRRNAFRGNP